MSDFRTIAPFVNQASTATPSSSQRRTTSTQNSSPSQTTSNSANEGTPSRGNKRQASVSSQRRRRTPGQVATLACTECRKARAKCNGERPEPCNRCVNRNLTCVYELHTKTHKDDLLKEIEAIKAENTNLQNEQRDLQKERSDLTKDKEHLQSRHEVQEVILDILTNHGHDREIIKRLQSGDSRASVAQWLLQLPNISQHLRTIPASQKELLKIVQQLEEQYEEPEGETGGFRPNAFKKYRWTKITLSQPLIGHLFELYFTWVHPIHMLFSESDFLNAYENGDETYCSSALVNSICAMGCILLDNPRKNRELTEEYPGDTYQDAIQLRGAFIAEARARLPPKSYNDWTSIHAFAVIHLVELSSGKARSATAYIRSAADYMKISAPSEQTNEAIQLAYWGIHTLNTVWSGFTYQKPFAPESPRSNVYFELQADKDDGSSSWHFHRQPGDEVECQKRPSFSILTACHQAKLFRVVHNTINIYCGARGRVTAQAIVACYKRYLNWSEDLPAQLRIEAASQPLPHVLALHIQYHTALIQLLVPLLRSQLFSMTRTEELRRMIIEHARKGLDLLLLSVQLYSSRYHMPITTFCVVHLGDTMVRYSSGEDLVSRDKAIRVCLETLQHTRIGFGLCGPLQQMFRLTVNNHGIVLPGDMVRKMGSPNRYGLEDILDACTRLDYSQPIENILGYIDHQIADTWHEEWRNQIGEQIGQKVQNQTDEPRRSTTRLEINALLNT